MMGKELVLREAEIKKRVERSQLTELLEEMGEAGIQIMGKGFSFKVEKRKFFCESKCGGNYAGGLRTV